MNTAQFHRRIRHEQRKVMIFTIVLWFLIACVFFLGVMAYADFKGLIIHEQPTVTGPVMLS